MTAEVLFGLATVFVYAFAKWYAYNLQFSSIPTAGFSEPILSWISGICFIWDAKAMLRKGYEKHNPGVFKIANFDGWVVVAAGAQYIDEVRKAPDTFLSFTEAAEQRQQIKHTLGAGLGAGYHLDMIRTHLTRNLESLFDSLHDETAAAFSDFIQPNETGQWVEIRSLSLLQYVICRVSNRAFVGLPLCRSEEWVKLNIDFTLDAAIGAQILRIFPEFMKPLASRLLTKVSSSHKLGFQLAQPIMHVKHLETRLRMMEKHGDRWDERPNDLLQWLMDSKDGRKQRPQDYCRRLMSINFAAIHTSSVNMTQALHRIASHPEWQKVLREEVEGVVQAHGLTKSSMDKMCKLDSFLREQQRCNGLGTLAMTRIALQPFTFSNGVRVPKGAFVACAQTATHHDERNYANPHTFDPWRFCSTDTVPGKDTGHDLVTTSNTFLNFGHGRHACPGRFFAAIELKCLLAHIVLHYDVAFPQGVGYPPEKLVNGYYIPTDVPVMFRKRLDAELP
ncbi:cytochrome P450 [Peniophora sp. CONT]|nr:cytochrome P450 [Peniophora sp. CONT]